LASAKAAQEAKEAEAAKLQTNVQGLLKSSRNKNATIDVLKNQLDKKVKGLMTHDEVRRLILKERLKFKLYNMFGKDVPGFNKISTSVNNLLDNSLTDKHIYLANVAAVFNRFAKPSGRIFKRMPLNNITSHLKGIDRLMNLDDIKKAVQEDLEDFVMPPQVRTPTSSPVGARGGQRRQTRRRKIPASRRRSRRQRK
jgi:hypothetical protein